MFHGEVMRRTYIHISDVHFGQERGSDSHVHQDVREQLVADARARAAEEVDGRIHGIVITGDIAFSGKEAQYIQAGRWLDRLAEAIGCEREDVFVVPGNHDIDRDEMTPACELVLAAVRDQGEERLERHLRHAIDRELLYARFKGYRAFAEAYECRIEEESGYTVNERVPIGPRRSLRIVGLNSALTCSPGDEDEGHLLVGARQRTLPQRCDEELVVLCHHPPRLAARLGSNGAIREGSGASVCERPYAQPILVGGVRHQ